MDKIATNEDEGGFDKQLMLRIMFMVSVFHEFINRGMQNSVPAERGFVMI